MMRPSDAGRGQTVAGDEVGRAARIAFEEAQRAALLSVVQHLLGQLQERLFVDRLAGIERRQ